MVAEARSADEPVLTRRCVVMKVPDFTTENYLEAQRQSAAAVLILLPKNISALPHDAVQVTRKKDLQLLVPIQFLNIMHCTLQKLYDHCFLFPLAVLHGE